LIALVFVVQGLVFCFGFFWTVCAGSFAKAERPAETRHEYAGYVIA
jgi:hypothetical protein